MVKPNHATKGTFRRSGPSPLAKAKESLTISELWPMLGFDGMPAKSCRCPWREDRKPSFSVRSDGRLWNDYSTGERGDAVSFLGAALSLSPPEAARRFIEMANSPSLVLSPARQRPAPEPQLETMPTLPAMTEGTRADWVELAILRKIPLNGIRAAIEAGHLRFGEHSAPRAKESRRAFWIVDSTRRNAHARRMDGDAWWKDGPKSLGLVGVQAAWPIGAADIGDKPSVALVEGEPDLLAAWAMIRADGSDVAPVAILGATNKIHPDALPFFAGKNIKLYPHKDPKGQGMRAAMRWAGQLQQAGAGSVSAFSFDGMARRDGKPVADLNDFIYSPSWKGSGTADLCPECWANAVVSYLSPKFPCKHQREAIND